MKKEAQNKIVVGVVHGGLGVDRDKSVVYGKEVKKILEKLGMIVSELHLHPNGSWTANGKIENIVESLKKVDKVWNCLVGVDGERGQVEKLCEKCGVKLIGHSLLHTNLFADKTNLKLLLAQNKIKSPYGKVLKYENYSKEKLKEIFREVGVPAVVKPNIGSGLVGLKVVSNFSELEEAVESLISKSEDVLVEKLVKGVPVSCFVFTHDNLLHTSIKVHDNTKILSREDILKIRNEALFIHNILACTSHAEYDFILTPKTLFFVEANTHPSLSSGYIWNLFKKGMVSLEGYLTQRLSG